LQFQKAAHDLIVRTLEDLNEVRDETKLAEVRGLLAQFSATYRSQLDDCSIPTLEALGAWGDRKLIDAVRDAFEQVEDLNQSFDAALTRKLDSADIKRQFHSRCAFVLKQLAKHC